MVDSYLEAKQEAARQKVLNKKLTMEDLLRADDDQSGEVSMAEFMVFKLEKMGLVSGDAMKTIQHQFEKVDTDGSGVLTFEDIEQALAAGLL